MELEELKQSWLKIEKGITELSGQTLKTTHIISAIRKTDAKTRLLNRFRIGYAITAICIIIMALSPLWSPGYMPKWWATTGGRTETKAMQAMPSANRLRAQEAATTIA